MSNYSIYKIKKQLKIMLKLGMFLVSVLAFSASVPLGVEKYGLGLSKQPLQIELEKFTKKEQE